ncbi:uncharacterized protein LOC122208039 isoform X3 [Panthera leo]|uniref:uncharacterized protein LOC122208039 isoform X3 n=1 Tax=Panthera leo TaxID=9689 RepID=UPI001C6A8A27|nr:uncharacterized protein LOC122208039 isoform X3 [Panthera leo]
MRNRAGLGVRKVPAGAESWGGASGGACPAPPPWLARHRAAGRRRWSGGLSFCPGCGGRRRCLRERRGRVRGCGLSPAALSLAHRLPLQVRRLDPRLRHCGESCRSGACPADQGGSHLIKPSFPSSPCGSETTGPEAHGAHRAPLPCLPPLLPCLHFSMRMFPKAAPETSSLSQRRLPSKALSTI